ncbi:MAG TPA: ATP-binding protein [Bryobacteraceae bacterium]
MKSLFLRMFLWFCAANAVLIAALVTGYEISNPDQLPFTWPRVGKGAILSAGRAAAEIYEHSGREELARDLGILAHDTGLQGSLFDSSRRDLSGGSADVQIPPELWSRPIGDLLLRGRDRLAAVQVVSASGQSYAFVARVPRREPSGFWSRMYVGALILIGALLCYLLARHITMPVAQLRTLTSEFSRGDFSARMTLPNVLQRKDEIGGLARDFNVMASRIEVLVNAQHRLIADVSHELRSPLTRLRLALGLLRRRKETDAQTSLARMEREVERLDLLISQLLTLSRLESLSQPPRMEALDLSALVKEVFADADFEATSMDRSVQLLECADCRVRGEADLIRSAMENVVRNALKYSHSKTTVYIRLLRCTTNRTAIITVEDEGPGVPGEMLCHIFEPFYRVDEARDRQTGGAGLGLAISHRITILHGGTIVAANREIGGLAVRIALPICE